MTIFNILFSFTIILVIAQLFFEGIAQEIYARFKKLGYEMKANPMWSLSNVSSFWREARKKNAELKDKKIASLLLYRTTWSALVIFSFIGMLIFL